MDSIFNFAKINTKEEFTESKKDILKFLKIIGVDSRYVSYTPSKLYINNLRFSKFSRKKESTFKKQFPNIDIVRSTLFQKICTKASRVLSDEISPNDKILILDDESGLINIILEPYSRKYGVEFIYNSEEEYDKVANPLILDDEVNNILSTIFKGEGIDFNQKSSKEIHPFIHVPKEWINSFLKSQNEDIIKNNKEEDEYKNIASSFMDFLEDTAPQYKDNVLKAKDYIKNNLK